MQTLRITGIAIGIAGFGLLWLLRFRGRRLRNLDWLIGSCVSASFVALGAFPDALNALLAFFSFDKGGGERLIGLLIFSNVILYFLAYTALSRNNRVEEQLDRLVRELAKKEFRKAHDRQDAELLVVIPAYNEADNIQTVLERIPETVLDMRTRTVVIVDGATDNTEQVVQALNRATISYTINRGGGSALKAGYEIALEDNAQILVTLDADGQHLPEEISVLVQPILDDEADLVNGSRVLGTYEKDSELRATGVVLFNRLISLLTMTRITDASNAFRAIRTSHLARLELHQSQFHSSEMLIEALRKGLRVKEVPITIQRRMSGQSKKGPSLRYGWGFAKAILSTWLR